MNTLLINTIIERENTYRSLIRKAKNYRDITGKPSETECKLLQKAADIKAEIIQLTANPGGTEAEKRSHEIELAELNMRISQIKKDLTPEKVKPTGNSSPNGNDSSKSSDYDPDEINTSSWYKEPPKHNFDKVSGMEDVKRKLRNCMIDTELEKLAQRLNMKLLNSFFFVGPPGCGKTYIIEAFVRELMDKQDYKYIALNGADIISKYVGDAEKIVERLFTEAVNNAPCVVFLDEIDGVCKNRSIQALPEYAASITTSFLMGYNKINNSDSKIIFIGATNYPKKVDSAMMDRVEVVMVGLPDTEAREFAFSMHFKDLIKLDDDIDFTYMAEKTEGYNYRDIDRVVENIKKNIFNEMSEVLRNESGTVDAQQIVENAVKSLDEGRFMLDKQRFDAVIDVFTPSNKTDIINDINDWLRMMNDDDPSRDLPKSAEPIKEVNDTPDEETDTVELSDEPQRMKEDIELFVSELEKQDSKEASVKTAESIQESDVQNSNTAGKVIETASTIAPIVEGLAESMFLDPVSGLVKVVFKIAGAVLPKVIAAFNGNNYEAKHEKDDLYSFSFKPDDSNAGQYSFDIMGDRGYIGTLEAKMDPPLGHPEFDI